MKQKTFTGWVDGHYIKGTFTEKDEKDFEEEAAKSNESTLLGTICKIGIGLAILGMMSSKEE